MTWRIMLHNLRLTTILDPMNGKTGTCQVCGSWFSLNGRLARYCSKKCRNLASNSRNRHAGT